MCSVVVPKSGWWEEGDSLKALPASACPPPGPVLLQQHTRSRFKVIYCRSLLPHSEIPSGVLEVFLWHHTWGRHIPTHEKGSNKNELQKGNGWGVPGGSSIPRQIYLINPETQLYIEAEICTKHTLPPYAVPLPSRTAPPWFLGKLAQLTWFRMVKTGVGSWSRDDPSQYTPCHHNEFVRDGHVTSQIPFWNFYLSCWGKVFLFSKNHNCKHNVLVSLG